MKATDPSGHTNWVSERSSWGWVRVKRIVYYIIFEVIGERSVVSFWVYAVILGSRLCSCRSHLHCCSLWVVHSHYHPRSWISEKLINWAWNGSTAEEVCTPRRYRGATVGRFFQEEKDGQLCGDASHSLAPTDWWALLWWLGQSTPEK